MKKIVMCVVLMSMVAFTGFAQTEDAETYKFMYDSATTVTGQLEILQAMAEANLSGLGDYYVTVLRRLIAHYPNVNNATDCWASCEQVRLLAVLLAAEKHTEAANDLWDAFDTFVMYPVTRADILMALGRMQAMDHLPHVIRTLWNLNAEAPVGIQIEYGSKIALGAILSLEKYADPSGFVQVYLASIPESWYPNFVREQAKKSFPLISDDPTQYIIEMIYKREDSFAIKRSAIEHLHTTGVSDDNKSKIAVASLAEAWKLHVNRDSVLGMMRKQAMKMIAEYKTDDDSVYALLERSYRHGYDREEQIDALDTLASLGTDEATRLLSAFLMEWNGRRQSGYIEPGDEIFVRLVITALGKAKNSNGIPALRVVAAMNEWTNPVRNAARQAIRDING